MSNQCPFCEIARGEVDTDLVAFRGERVFVFPTLKQRPSNRGQVLVCPIAHETSLRSASPELRNELFRVVDQVVAAAPPAFAAVGTTLMVNQGAPTKSSITCMST